MSAYVSAIEDLVLHGPRVLGFATASRVAARYDLTVGVVDELLLDFEANGWVSQSSFAEHSGWSVTDTGRAENERRLGAELDHAGAREAVLDAHTDFVPLNRRFGVACTNWQIRPTRAEPMGRNDHTDHRWDERVLRTLNSLDHAFSQVCRPLADRLQRFEGYGDRYSAALAKVERGQRQWVDAPGMDSCHTVWVQFHEDLIATLGIPRGSDD